MFSKLRHHAHKFKEFLGRTYTHGKNFLGHIDNAVQNGKRLYSLVEPLISHYSPGHSKQLTDSVMKGISAYDSIKNKVIENHDIIHHHTKKLHNLL